MITLYALFGLSGTANFVGTYRTLNAAKSAATQKLGGVRDAKRWPWEATGDVWKRCFYRIVPVAVSVPTK